MFVGIKYLKTIVANLPFGAFKTEMVLWHGETPVAAHITIQHKDTYKAAAEHILKMLLILTLATIIPGIHLYIHYVAARSAIGQPKTHF